jgi:NAD(P)-dependent dehydrogenase (short-subunit alcohol dehydrogenase family)
MGRLEGKTAIVTGAGRGIGRQIAKAFAVEGAQVAIAARTVDQLEETRGLIEGEGGRCLVVPTDITDRVSVATLVARTREHLGPVDVLMNNAGSFATIGPVADVDPDMWWRDVTVNLFGPFLCCHEVLPDMLKRGRGTIINMTGGGTAGPFPYGSGYGSSKAAVMRFTECLDREVADTGVIVFAMGPGLVRTAMTQYQLDTEAGRKWLGRIETLFDEGRDVPPTRAAELAVQLASGRFDEFHGRGFGVQDDLERVIRERSRILSGDLKTLRMLNLD